MWQKIKRLSVKVNTKRFFDGVELCFSSAFSRLSQHKSLFAKLVTSRSVTVISLKIFISRSHSFYCNLMRLEVNFWPARNLYFLEDFFSSFTKRFCSSHAEPTVPINYLTISLSRCNAFYFLPLLLRWSLNLLLHFWFMVKTVCELLVLFFSLRVKGEKKPRRKCVSPCRLVSDSTCTNFYICFLFSHFADFTSVVRKVEEFICYTQIKCVRQERNCFHFFRFLAISRTREGITKHLLGFRNNFFVFVTLKQL